MARSEEVAEQAIAARGRGARRQARLRRGAGVPLLLPEAAALAAPRRRARTCAPAARSWSTRSCARWRSCSACSGSRSRSGCEARRSSASRSGTATGRATTPMRADYVRSVSSARAPCRWCCRRCRPRTPRTLARPPRRRSCSRAASTSIPRSTARPPHPKLGRVDRERDDFELALTREALRRDLPILAICRGQQVLNVATGGTLIQDIPSELEGAVTHDGAGPSDCAGRTAVEVLAGSRLREILGQGTLSVNSFHHQAIDRLGEGLVVSGRCPDDGVIEAVEMTDARASCSACSGTPSRSGSEAASFQALFDAHAAACHAASPVRSR